MKSNTTYALDIYKASIEEPLSRVVARLREALDSQDKVATEVYLQILEERSARGEEFLARRGVAVS